MATASLQIQGAGNQGGGHALPELVVTTVDPTLGRESPIKEVAPPSPSVLPVILKSNLHKKGKRFKGWHQRYFEIQGKHLYYYKNHTKMDCLGEIDLSLCIHCGVSDEATFGAPFEISTTVRTHVLSARSPVERDQWIRAIKSQMEVGSGRKISQTKPKRWKTFRDHFKFPQRQQQHRKVHTPALAKVTKRKSFMDRFRIRRSNTPAHLKFGKHSGEEPRSHDRPLSLTDEQVPKDALEALLDNLPSRSLPATPLSKKRSETVNYSPPMSPMFAEPTASPTNNVLMSVPVEINSSLDEKKSTDEDISMVTENNQTEDNEPRQEPMLFEKEFSSWDKMREVLQISNQTQLVLCDDNEDQEWAKHSTGLEQLRAFLAVCD